VGERSKQRATRRAGMLLGAALLLALGALLGSRAGAPAPGPVAPPAGALAGSEPAARSALALAAPAPHGERTASAPAADRDRADRAAQAPVVEDDPGERALYDGYRALLARDPDALDREMQRALEDGVPRNRRVALLRAAWDLGLPGAPALFRQALRSPADDADRDLVSLADFALRFLGERSAHEPLAWTTLFDAVQTEATLEPRLRSTAAIRLVESAPPSELPRLVALVQEAPESDVAQSLVAALRSRADDGARAALRDLSR
jgi:hypothetical protein